MKIWNLVVTVFNTVCFLVAIYFLWKTYKNLQTIDRFNEETRRLQEEIQRTGELGEREDWGGR